MVSVSLFSQYGLAEVHEFLGSDNRLLEGTVIDEDVSISGVKNCVLRFKNGRLDGGAQPAVECKGHTEYWKEGKLHRDNGLPAVSSAGFTVQEYWQDGKRLS